MAIVSSDIKYKLSGGSSNSDPTASIGGAISSVDAPSSYFPDVGSAEAAAGSIKYRCIYVLNNNSTQTLLGAKIWIQANTPSTSTDIAIGLGAAGLDGTETAIANDTTAPSGVTFSSPSNLSGGLSLTDVPDGEYYPVWVRRTVTAGAAAATDTFTLRAQGDTNP